MGSGSPITEDEFRLIKSHLREIRSIDIVAVMTDRHKAIVAKINNAKTFADYKEMSRAEHPPVKNSLGNRVAKLERRVDALEELSEVDQRNKTQLALELNHD